MLFIDSSDWSITLEPSSTGTRIVQAFQLTRCPRWWEWIVARANPRHVDRSAALTEDLHRIAAVAAADVTPARSELRSLPNGPGFSPVCWPGRPGRAPADGMTGRTVRTP